jgi:hypothetical protein
VTIDHDRAHDAHARIARPSSRFSARELLRAGAVRRYESKFHHAVRRAGSSRSSLLCALPILLASCTADEPISEVREASTVLDEVSSGCSTAVVIGLSRQIADEVSCEHPGGLVPFPESDTIALTSSAVLPYLEQDAAADLTEVAASNPVQVNSAFRTIAQQYLLYRWYLAGSCGITAAATVGNSNHESGRAIDLENWSERVSAMAANGWAHDVPGDDVHFDHTASPDIRGEDVTAFQTLWNRNHPEDLIGVDGDYGPQTEARLRQAPATGFAQGASCVTQPHAQVVAVSGPDLAPPHTRVHYRITLSNGSGADWPDTTELAIVGSSSPLYDPSWISTTVIATLGAPVAAGANAMIDLDVTTPAVTDPTPIAQPLALSDGTNTLGTVSLALTVVPDTMGSGSGSADPTQQSSDGDDHHDPGITTGGCAAGGGSCGPGALALVLGALLARRKRP